MAEVNEQNMTIGNLVDLDGRHIQDEVQCEEDDSEFCPQDLREEVEAGKPDEREYEGYQGNVRVSIHLRRVLNLSSLSGSRLSGIMSVDSYSCNFSLMSIRVSPNSPCHLATSS
jgi:hypothetical protein